MIKFFVAGKPQTAGSKRGFPIKRANGSIGVAMSDDNPKGKDWKQSVRTEAEKHVEGLPLLTTPLTVTFHFFVHRPKGHFGSGKNSEVVKSTSPKYPASKPDVLKLSRCVEDALTGIIWKDDAQIVEEVLMKSYAGINDREGVLVIIQETA